MERTEQMYTIQKQMDFGKIKVGAHKKDTNDDEVKKVQLLFDVCLCARQPFPLVSASRWLRKRGELAISSEELSIWRAFSHRSNYLFLFNDVLIVTRKKRSLSSH